jgi:hypothetical protein
MLLGWGAEHQGERRVAAAEGVGLVAEDNGCHSFAPPCWLGNCISHPAFALHRTTVPVGNLVPKGRPSRASTRLPITFCL